MSYSAEGGKYMTSCDILFSFSSCEEQEVKRPENQKDHDARFLVSLLTLL